MKIRFAILTLGMIFNCLPAFAALLGERDLDYYIRRDFTALRVLAKSESIRQFADLQERDLRECRLLHEGEGDLKTVLQCMRFLSRENVAGVRSSSSRNLWIEMNRLCSKLAQRSHIDFVLGLAFDWSVSLGDSRCKTHLLELAYREIYELWEKNPVKAWALFNKAVRVMGVDSTWKLRVRKALGADLRASWSEN